MGVSFLGVIFVPPGNVKAHGKWNQPYQVTWLRECSKEPVSRRRPAIHGCSIHAKTVNTLGLPPELTWRQLMPMCLGQKLDLFAGPNRKPMTILWIAIGHRPRPLAVGLGNYTTVPRVAIGLSPEKLPPPPLPPTPHSQLLVTPPYRCRGTKRFRCYRSPDRGGGVLG